jgi:hypothetical protein
MILATIFDSLAISIAFLDKEFIDLQRIIPSSLTRDASGYEDIDILRLSGISQTTKNRKKRRAKAKPPDRYFYKGSVFGINETTGKKS